TAGVKEPNISVTLETARDWTAEHSKQLPPINIGRCFVYGSGYSGAVPAGKIGLRVPAGAAFGSGNHATTKGCLLAMDRMRVISDGPVLDMGSGSGILALAAARLWRRPVLAVDIDPVAVQVATENIAANCQKHLVKGICAPGYRHRDIGSKKFDVIISNILARPLVRMACDLVHHLAPGGIAVLSGLYSQDANWVLGAHRRVGLRKVGRIDLDGWATLVMRGKGV
ncbi:MAG: 50S ribosomal protein L11 methyltransferase, partial [Pseudomonadota bacterium]|nr:50S ribosomal protein L11 methyltransferase [Pseudomonadota bacterium]